MSSNGSGGGESAAVAPAPLWRLDDATAAPLANQVEVFEDLQTVLRCCERLVAEIGGSTVDEIVVEAVWTTALLSYARCFAADHDGAALTEDDVRTAHSNGDEVVRWHRLLLQLRDHYADPARNPREQFSVGISRDAEGGVVGVAITSARQPLVDDLTVRQTGAIAYALSAIANSRIDTRQTEVFDQVRSRSTAELDALGGLDVSTAAPGS